MQKDIKWEDPKGKGTFAPNQSLLYYWLGIYSISIVFIVPGEMGGEGVFAHLYNGKLGKEEVESVVVWENDNAGWDERLKEAESWLVY